MPAPDDLLAPEDPQNAEGPRNPKDLLGPEDQKSPEDSKDKMPAREEAEEQGQAPGGGLDHPSRRSPQRRGRGIPQAPVTEVQSRRLGAQPGRPGPVDHSQLIGRLIPLGRNARVALPPGQEDPITRAPHSFQEKEAKRAASASHKRSPGEELVEDRRKEEELEVTRGHLESLKGPNRGPSAVAGRRTLPAERSKKRKASRGTRQDPIERHKRISPAPRAFLQ